MKKATPQRSRKAPARSAAVPKQLREYQRKRDFAITTEPAPAEAERHGGPATFMIHKHDATRLHYDLRLEMDGALASWSVPKGPSYDPAIKRLAIQTEDHPLQYGGFEGRIPDGQYGAGDSLIWERGVYDTIPPGQASEQRQKGRLHLVLLGEKLKGGWHLIKSGRPQGGKEAWLLFKAKDETATNQGDIVAERPESVVSGRVVTRGPERAKVLRAPHPPPETLLAKLFPPMLATLADSIQKSDEYRYEMKYDGYRAVCALSAGKVAIWTRNGLDLNARFPAIAHALSGVIVGEAVIDAEVAVLDKKGRPRFELMHDGNNDALLFAFDLLWLNGEDLRARPLEERRDLLSSLLANADSLLRLSELVDGPADAALKEATRRGWEGIVAKKRGSEYENKRSRSWLKLKAQKGQELIVIGYTPSTKDEREIGALLLGVMDGGALRFAGKVGTGFSNKLRRELFEKLKADKREAAPAKDAPRLRTATWVKPRLVAQVQFTEWTKDGKLRHPSFQGLREDKAVEEVIREKSS